MQSTANPLLGSGGLTLVLCHAHRRDSVGECDFAVNTVIDTKVKVLGTFHYIHCLDRFLSEE